MRKSTKTDTKLEKQREKIRQSLIDQLKAKGASIEAYINMIDDYMTMWDEKEMLKADMKEKGLRYTVISGNGFETDRDNASFKVFPLVNKQMLMLLKQMGLTTKDAIEDMGDDEL